MKQVKTGLAALALTVIGTALAGGGYTAPAAEEVDAQAGIAYQYDCAQGVTVGTRYIISDPDNKNEPVLLVLNYSGKRYGLAPAPSASGTRYVGLSGLDTASGLEWWEHHNEGTLSRYNPETGDTTPIVQSCKIRL